MKTEFKKGYTVYKNKDDPVFVVPHSGPALEIATSRDDNAETVASLCWKKDGGVLIVSGISRRRQWGIDFNRDIPSIDKAIDTSIWVNDDIEKMFEYKQKYAWVAFDEKDYEAKLKIYQNFWADVSKGKKIIFVHRSFPKIRSVPSVMDVVTFGGEGVKKKVIQEIVSDVNSKYFDFFQKIDKDYKQSIILETKRTILDTLRIFKSFDMGKINGWHKYYLERDLERINEYCDKEMLEELKKNFTPQNYLIAVESALKNIPDPKITIENVFDGTFALGPKRKLFPLHGKTIISVESSRFMNFWHPDTASEMILDIVRRL